MENESFVTAGNEYYIRTYDKEKKILCTVIKIIEVYKIAVFVGLYEECEAYLNSVLDANFEEDYYDYEEYIKYENVKINNARELHEFIKTIDYIL